MTFEAWLLEKLSDPKVKAAILRYVWAISFLMMVLGYLIVIYVIL